MFIHNERWLPAQNQIRAMLVLAALLLLVACGGDAAAPASDPPGALVRLQRNDGVAALPGDLTIFSGGGLQLYLGERGALRKNVDPADLAGLRAALGDPGVASLAATYPAALPAGAGDTLTIYGAQRRAVRYNPDAPDLPPVLQRLIAEIMRLRQRF
jgi:hypothetical protein